MNPSCSHGEMKLRNGVKDGRPWSGYFCPTPKGTPDQCGPQFIKENKNVSQQIQYGDWNSMITHSYPMVFHLFPQDVFQQIREGD